MRCRAPAPAGRLVALWACALSAGNSAARHRAEVAGAGLPSMTLLARLDALITPARTRRWTIFTLACQLAVFVTVILGTHGLLVRLDRPCTTDFVSFYAAGRLADGLHPSAVYDRAIHFAAEQNIVARGIDYVFFFYPPVYLLLCGLLARLPYLLAFIAFETISTICCVLVLRMIAGASLRACALVAFSFSPLLWNVGFGQNACLTASLLGLGTLLLQRGRPISGGLVLSCLIFKPHTGLLVPLALAASRSWLGFAAAATGAIALAGLSALVFGIDAWRSFLTAIWHAQGQFAAGQVAQLATLASSYGAARMLGLPQSTAYACEAMVALSVITCVAWSWRSGDREREARYAVLVAGTQLIMPVVLFYDTTFLLIAGAWLLRAADREGEVRGEKAGLAAIWLAGLVCYPVMRASHLPVAFAMAALLLVLALRRQAVRSSGSPVGNQRVAVCSGARGSLPCSRL